LEKGEGEDQGGKWSITIGGVLKRSSSKVLLSDL
jgi:hypothetical protein